VAAAVARSGRRSPLHVFFSNTARSDGIEFRTERGDVGSSEDRGPQGSAVLEGDGDRSRPLRRKRTGACRRRLWSLARTPTLYVHARIREVAVSQEEDYGVVAEARPPGTASSPWSLFARRQWIVRESGECTHRTRYCRRRSLRPRSGSSGNTEQGS